MAPGGARRATLVGASALGLWSTLALSSTFTRRIPPLQLVAITFAIAGLVGLVVALARGRSPAALFRQPPAAWALGVLGLFGYHALYFAALQLAPDATVEVGLLNYLWPLLIVLFSALSPGARVTGAHLLGAAMGLAGTVLVVGAGGRLSSLDPAQLPAFGLAAAAAVVWAGYSVLSRRFGAVPSEAVGGSCLLTSALALLAHLALERTVLPDAREWLVLALVGLGPAGAAFFLWDHGVKHGELPTLGALSYATPLLSTLLLVAFHGANAGPSLLVAGALIVGGGALASRATRR